jgi:hypothetical protein
MGYFEDYKDGYAEADEIERERMEEAGFDPDCIEDKRAWRSKGVDEPTFIVRIDTGEYTDTLSTHNTRQEAERAGGDWLMMIMGVETREDVLDECSYEILEERK